MITKLYQLRVTIGDNSVIGAGSVVTKDIPANVVAVGNPCKVLREFDERDKKQALEPMEKSMKKKFSTQS